MAPNDLQTPEAVKAVSGEVIKFEVTLPNERRVREANALLVCANEIVIDSPEALQYAADDRNVWRTLWQNYEKERKYMKEPSLEAGRRVDAFFAQMLVPLEHAGGIVSAKILHYNRVQAEIREAAEREARAKQEREAAEQRAQAAKIEAEAQAKAAELRRQEEEARERERQAIAEGDAKAAAKAAGDAAKLASKAESTQSAGEEKSRAMQVAADETAAAPVCVEDAPKVNGIGTQTRWEAVVENPLAFITFIVTQRPDLISMVTFDQSALNKQASSLKKAMAFDGVKACEKAHLTKARK